MRLATFIRGNLERILDEWEQFARTIVPRDSMSIAGLRDHALEILRVAASDLERFETEEEKSDRSKGLADADADAASPDTPAQAHGEGRAVSGFTLTQMLSEFRALRASVVRLWTDEHGALSAGDVADLIRFNEAIDQALAESAGRFSEDVDRTREIFLGILGHDLRTPLGAIQTSAQFMLELDALPPPADALAARVVSSAVRMNRMIEDLLEFTRGQLGASVPVVREPLDLRALLEDAVEELSAAHPGVDVALHATGQLTGEWDPARLSQVFGNLLGNARSHGAAHQPIEVTADGDADTVTVQVRNAGPPIPEEELAGLLKPMKPNSGATRDREHLGLGLYIVQQAVSAHAGTVSVRSDASGTTFTVSLPRRSATEREKIRAREALATWEDEGGSARPRRARGGRSPSTRGG